MTFIKDDHISLTPLKEKTIAIIGYGNQGKPQAQNCRDSGIRTIVGLRASSTKWDDAQQEGFNPVPLAEAIRQAEVVMMLVPDEQMAAVYESDVKPHLSPGQYIGFGHGLAICSNWLQLRPDTNVFLLAPKGQGRGVRRRYEIGSGVPGLAAVHQDPSGNTWDIALAYGKALGCSRIGILKTTFQNETVCDLFSEQTVLCGGLSHLIQSAFDTLVEAGYDPYVAYFECLFEVKLIADLIFDYGISGMRDRISTTALFGDLTQGPNVMDSHVKESMRHILERIENQTFAQHFHDDVQDHSTLMRSLQESERHHPIERIDHDLREQQILSSH